MTAVFCVVVTIGTLGTSTQVAAQEFPSRFGGQYGFNEADVHTERAGDYDQVSYRGAIPYDEDESRLGQPILPVVLKWFILPDGTKIDSFHVTVASWTTLPGRYLVPPIQSTRADAETVDPDADIYESSTPYPRKIVYTAADSWMRGYHLAKIGLYPVSYIPSARQLRIPTALRVDLYLRPLTAAESGRILRIARPDGRDTPNGSEIRWIRSMVENPDDFARLYRPTGRTRDRSTLQSATTSPYGAIPSQWPSVESPPVREVIITDNYTLAGEYIGDLVHEFELYAAWKQDTLAIPTQVRRVSEIREQYRGQDEAQSIKRFIKHCYEEWAITYVLLGGDIDIVPTRRVGGPYTSPAEERDPPCDVYYSRYFGGDDWNLDGDAFIWETKSDGAFAAESAFDQVYVGRLPCKNAATARTMIDKLKSYQEQSSPPTSNSYYTSALFAAGPLNSYHVPTGPLYDLSGYSCSEFIIDSLQAVAPEWTPTRLYGMIPPDSLECDSDMARCFDSLKTWLDDLKDEEGITDWLYAGLRDELETGYHLVYHAEHSNRFALGQPSDRAPTEEGPEDSLCVHFYDFNNLCREHLSFYWRDHVSNFSAGQAYFLTNASGETDHRYSWVFSSGSHTNMFDMHSISETLLQAPEGGAVAYVGKTSTRGDPRGWLLRRSSRTSLASEWRSASRSRPASKPRRLTTQSRWSTPPSSSCWAIRQ